MRKFMVALVAITLASLSMAGTASAQDAFIGTVTADPATVPEAGRYTFTATGTDFIPDTYSVLLVKCVAPAATLVPGVSDLEEITAAAQAISPLADCDVGAARNTQDVDSSGGWTAELTADVGDNFFLFAFALDGSQAGAAWVPIVPVGAGGGDAEVELAATGVETGLMAVIGIAVLGAGVMLARESLRLS